MFDRNGSMYSGLSNGQIVRIDKDGHIEKIVQVGEERDERVCGNEENVILTFLLIICQMRKTFF